MSSNSEKGLVRVKEKIPYTGKGVENLVIMVRKILTENRNTQKVVLEVGVPHIYIEKLVPEAEAAKEAPLSLHDAIRAKPMEEYPLDEVTQKQTGIQKVWEMFSMIHAEGFEVSHIAIGDKQTFQKWLGIRMPVTKMAFFGIPVAQVPEIPPDVVLVCGSATREADPEDVQFSVKVSIV